MLDMMTLEINYPERALLIYTSRLTINAEETQAIKRILDEKKVNWFEFAKLALFHKTITLCWFNLNKICLNHNMPKYLNDIIRYIYTCTQIRNTKNLEEVTVLLNKCKTEGITCIPVKGAYLIDRLYGDYGIRYSGDMDFLVKYDDIFVLKRILKDMGYVNGQYSSATQQIEPISRKEEIMWKMYMSNLAPFVKLGNSDVFPLYKLDFRYALDDSLNKEPIREIINFTTENGHTRPAYYLIHLCTHFFDEAKHSVTIARFKDVNMIKLCDIREFILKFVSQEEFIVAIKFCVKHNLKKALYYSMYFLDLIYSDGYEKEIMKMLDIKEDDFLETYGDSTMDNTFTYKKTFIERFFSCGNLDELKEEPKLNREL